MFRQVLASALAFTLLVAASPGIARDIGTPTGQVILSVTGTGGETWDFDRAMIEGLGWRTITTVTPFTEGMQEFSGIAIADLVAATGVSGTTVDAIALNDYRVEIPADHIEAHDVFLALDHNGEPMRVRDRGPVWIIYPADTLLAASERFDSFMVWQLRELHFR